MTPTKTPEMTAHDAQKELVTYLKTISEALVGDYKLGAETILEQALAYPGRILSHNPARYMTPLSSMAFDDLFGWNCDRNGHRSHSFSGVIKCAFCRSEMSE